MIIFQKSKLETKAIAAPVIEYTGINIIFRIKLSTTAKIKTIWKILCLPVIFKYIADTPKKEANN